MFQLLKRSWLVWLFAGGLQSASAFSLFGPFNEAYQQGGNPNQLSYGFLGDNGAPKNLGEEYRWNLPTIYYAFDQNFLDYFGSNGVVAIEQAIAILNGLSNFSSYSSDLSEFPLEAQRLNHRAAALSLFDLKSAALHLMVEQLGLAEPDRYTWTLRARIPRTACPFYEYHVIKRNFDPATFEPSSYVNGTLFSYRVLELCPTPDRADAVEFLVDPLATAFSAVASIGSLLRFADFIETDYGPARFGTFYTGLTRDDVGGLRYLMRTNNMNVEGVTPSSVLFATNTAAPQLLVTSNLATLLFQSLTNGPAALQALYPALCILNSTTTFSNVISTNFFAYFTNFPYSPAGTFSLVLATNLSTNVEPRFHYTFCNVVTNQSYTNGFLTLRDTTVSLDPFAPAGSGLLTTNVQSTTGISQFVNGDFYLIPTNLCGLQIVSTQLVQVMAVTNTIVATNAAGVANTNGQGFTRESITYSTNSTFVVYPIECQNNSVALRQGIDKVTFVRASFDSLLGQFFAPITNQYRLIAVTNNAPVVQTLQRVVIQPDWLFSASDLDTIVIARSINFDTINVLSGLAGPGRIEPPVLYSFNKVGPLLVNFNPDFIDEATAFTNFIWGSFDGSTNAVILYPNGTSIMDLENQVLIRVITTALPDGSRNAAYYTQLQASGGQPPYSWSLAPGSASLPPGLGLSPGGVISGTPTVAGTFNFTVHLTESAARSVDQDLSITISP